MTWYEGDGGMNRRGGTRSLVTGRPRKTSRERGPGAQTDLCYTFEASAACALKKI